MTNTKTTKRSLFSSVVALLLCFSMLLGTTYAWFTDTASNNGNKIVAGELDVELQMYDGGVYKNIGDNANPIFGVNSQNPIAQDNNADTLWEPGKTQVAYLAIKNDGNLDLKYTVALRVFGVKNDLHKVMKYAIIPDAHPTTAPVNGWDATKGKSVDIGTQTVSDGDVFLANRQTHYFALVIHMEETATNEYQNGEINFDLTVLATQVSSEKDSFGDTYDQNATYPILVQATQPVLSNNGLSTAEVRFSQEVEGSAISKVEVTVPVGAKLEDGTEELVLKVEEAKNVYHDVVIYASEEATTYDISIAGIASTNSEPITVTLFIEKNLEGVKLYHKSQEITDITYVKSTGELTFKTTSFSPFTVVHKKVGGSAEVDDSTIYVDTIQKLQAAIDMAEDGTIIKFAEDISGNVTVTQKEGVNIVIDGANRKYDGTIIIDGKARHTGAETLTIKNINFETATNGVDFISSNIAKQYAHNVTIDSCTFTNKGNGTVVPARFRQAYNITMKNCTIKDTFSPMWTTGVQGLTITNVIADCATEGITIGASNNVLIENCIITVPGKNSFGIRTDATDNYVLTVNNCELNVEKPIVIREQPNSNYSGAYKVIMDGKLIVNTAKQLQAMANAQTEGEITIVLCEDITGDVKITQKPDVKITIDGNDKTFEGVIVVDGKSATYTTAGLTIKNLNFQAGETSADAYINLGDNTDTNNTRYTCNVTVDSCTFDSSNATYETVGVKSYTGGDKNLKIVDCTVTERVHSLAQLKGIDGVLIKDCTVNSIRGINFNNSTNVVVDHCTIDVDKYALRFGESSGGAGAAETYTIKNSDLTSKNEDDDAVIVLRGTADNSTLNVTNTRMTGDIQITNTASNAIVIIDGVYYVSNDDELANVVKKGATNILLADGNYTMPQIDATKGKTITIFGTKDTVIDISAVPTNGSQAFTGTTLVFDGVTINCASVNYKGITHAASLTYKNCQINGLQFLFAEEVVFENCDLNSNGAEHCAWTWSGNRDISFTDCDFTYGDRAVNCYGENGTTNISFTDCTFTKVAGKDTTGAIETNSSTLTALNLTINNCTVNEGDLWWVSTWDSLNGANTTINIK